MRRWVCDLGRSICAALPSYAVVLGTAAFAHGEVVVFPAVTAWSHRARVVFFVTMAGSHCDFAILFITMAWAHRARVVFFSTTAFAYGDLAAFFRTIGLCCGQDGVGDGDAWSAAGNRVVDLSRPAWA